MPAKRVLIVDDSEAMCHFLRDVLSSDPELKVVGYALDAYEARSMIKMLNPDVLTLDVEMPRMDGLTFLKNLMRLRPMPVVMLSSLTAAGAQVTLDALHIGAQDFAVKRHPGTGEEYTRYVDDLIQRVKQAAHSKLPDPSSKKGNSSHPSYKTWQQHIAAQPELSPTVHRLLAIGASTGGPEAIREVLEHMYLPNCTLVLSQHMPSNFMEPFADRMDGLSRFTVSLAQAGAPLLPGHCYIAPGDRHLELTGKGSQLTLALSNADLCCGHRPSVDVMFRSVAKTVGASALSILLTGMGKDGAEGMQEMAAAGSFNLVQDEKSSVVWGMPGSATALGANHAELSLRDIGPTLESLLTHS